MLDSKVNDRLLEVYDFFANWCGPCKMQAPIIESLEKKYLDKVIFKKIDVDNQQDIARKYSVMSIPTIMFFYNDQEINERLTGFTPEDALCSIIDELLVKIDTGVFSEKSSCEI